MKKLFSLVVMLVACVSASFADVVDQLSSEWTGNGAFTGTTYVPFSGKKATSEAVYAGNCAGDYNTIQLRVTNSNEGIVTTGSGGAVRKVQVRYHNQTFTQRVVDIYAKNTPYTSAADLFSSDPEVQGTLVGSVAIDDLTADEDGYLSQTIEVTGDYQYVGVRSRNKAVYIKYVNITWDETYTPAPTGPAFDTTLCHTPRYTAGKTFETVWGPDLLVQKPKTVDGNVQMKWAVNDTKYDWVVFTNPTSSVDDGTVEVSTNNNAWTTNSPAVDYTENPVAVYLPTGNNGSTVAPTVDFTQWGKQMILYVKDTKRAVIYGTCTSSATEEEGNQLKVTVVSADNSDNKEVLSNKVMYGKKKGATSDGYCVVDLDPTKEYQLLVNETVATRTIEITGIQLYGASEVAGVAPHKANPTYTYWENVIGPDMIENKTLTNAEGTTASKPVIADGYEWIEYVNPTNTWVDGVEVQQSNRWNHYDPKTGEKVASQVKDANGDANCPVVSPYWGKSIKFNVTGTKLVKIYAVSNSSKTTADSKNQLVAAVRPYNSSNVVEFKTEEGSLYGKGSTSDVLVVSDLDENEAYEIEVYATFKNDNGDSGDVQISGIQLHTSEGIANQEAGLGTLNIAIAQAAQSSVDLAAGETYTVTGAAEVGLGVFIINGNGATIVPAEGAYISVQKGVIINDAIIDATASGVAPIQLSATPDASLSTQVEVPAVLYTAEEAAAYNEEHAEEIADGELAAVAAGDVKIAATTAMKYPNASWKGYEAELIALNNSTVMTANSLIRPAAAWALRNLTIDNTVVEVKYKSGKAIINMEENGAGVIQDINIKNSTIYADDPATEMRFHRYAAQNDPWRVWGYEGDDKNATIDTWTLTNNTFVGVCGNKDFSNNIKNTAATVFTFTNNVFVNTWRIQKLGSNCKRNFAQEDNLIMGGTQPVDGTDAKWFTAKEDLGVVWNFAVAGSETAAKAEGDPVAAPAATDLAAMGACFGVYDDYKTFGDPRWADYSKGADPTAISTVQTQTVADGATYNVAGQRVSANAKGLVIRNGKKFFNK